MSSQKKRKRMTMRTPRMKMKQSQLAAQVAIVATRLTSRQKTTTSSKMNTMMRKAKRMRSLRKRI